MFVFNFKVNGSKFFKYFFIAVVLLVILILSIVIFKVFNGANESSNRLCCNPSSDISKIAPKNYTNILKVIHENMDSYIGKKISFTGYVYRVFDLQENQFILARDMLINSNSQTVVVGFLCEYDNAKEFENDSWVEITGEIVKGDYHGNMPILKITDMHITQKPSEEYVYPPDDSYIPTNGIL